MMSILRCLVVGASGFYLLMALVLFYIQRDLLYFPTPPDPHSYSEQHVMSDGHAIKIIVLNEGQEKALIYFGGNGESAVRSAQWMDGMLANHTVYLMNYPGFGGSGGQPSEASFFAAADQLFAHVSAEHLSVTVVGRSLGTGVAVYLAARTQAIDKLILITPYDSIAALAAARYPFFPTRWMLLDRFDSVQRAADIRSPTLLVAASNDLVVPRANTQRLLSAFIPNTATLVTIPDSGHVDISDKPSYRQSLQRFILNDT